jgi:hypothetical protein
MEERETDRLVLGRERKDLHSTTTTTTTAPLFDVSVGGSRRVRVDGAALARSGTWWYKRAGAQGGATSPQKIEPGT